MRPVLVKPALPLFGSDSEILLMMGVSEVRFVGLVCSGVFGSFRDANSSGDLGRFSKRNVVVGALSQE